MVMGGHRVCNQLRDRPGGWFGGARTRGPCSPHMINRCNTERLRRTMDYLLLVDCHRGESTE